MGKLDDAMPCSIQRSLTVLGERWTFLILREAFFGRTRFAEFRAALGIAPDVLTDRLTTLVEHGVMEKVSYQEPGSRARFAYELTAAGRELDLALGVLQQWGDAHLPRPDGPTVERVVRGTERPAHVAFVDPDGRELAPGQVEARRTAAFPA